MEKAYARFEQYLNRPFGQSSTAKHYLSDLSIFIRVVGDKTPQDVTPADIDTFLDDQIACGLSPYTINRRLACLHSLSTLYAYLQQRKQTSADSQKVE